MDPSLALRLGIAAGVGGLDLRQSRDDSDTAAAAGGEWLRQLDAVDQYHAGGVAWHRLIPLALALHNPPCSVAPRPPPDVVILDCATTTNRTARRRVSIE